MNFRLTDEGLVAGARFVPSPNCDERPADCSIELLVIHAISLPPGEFGGPGIEQLFTNRLDPAAHPYYATVASLKVSSHFLIRRDGALVQFVPCRMRAWHAGESSWQGRTRCNDFSVGIELEGADDGDFEDAQYAALAGVTRALQARYAIAGIAGHSEIAPGRKTDPGPHFDWARYRALIAAPPEQIGRATPDDYPGILELQAANDVATLTEDERRSGFLSVQFTREQLAAMAEDLGILVARRAGRVVGYACAHRADMAPLPPVVQALLQNCRSAAYRGRLLATANLFVYGPVCIARKERGRGLLRALFRALGAEMAGTFQYAVTFVAATNPHSLRAHVQGLGMDEVGEYELDGRRYHVLVYALS